MTVWYEGVVCAGPNKGQMLTQSISSFSFQESELWSEMDKGTTMMLYPIGMSEDKHTIRGVWVPVQWDSARVQKYIINCVAANLQRDIEYVHEDFVGLR